MVLMMLEFDGDVAHASRMAVEGADSAQFNALEHEFRHVRAPLVAWFRRRVGDSTEAEDLAQECFLRIANRENSDAPAQFEAYLFRTARSVLFDRQRYRRVRKADAHVPLLAEHDPLDETNALRIALAKEKLREVTEILTRMPERTRSIFLLSRLEGMRYAEIATRFRISVSAVQKHMLRAIETLLLAGEEEA